jgi:Protein of unknown function (DUF3108)
MKRPHNIPLRTLALWTLWVLLLHWLLLAQPWHSVTTPGLAQTAVPMVTRTLALPPTQHPREANAWPPKKLDAKEAVSAAPTPKPSLANLKAPVTLPQRAEAIVVSKPSQLSADRGAERRDESIAQDPPVPVLAQEMPRLGEAMLLATAPAMPGVQANVSPVPYPVPRAAEVPLALPASQQLRYRVTGQAKGLSYQATATLSWRQDGAEYEAVLELGSFLGGVRRQTSTGQITPQGLAPSRFSDKSRSEQAAHFERDKGRISFSNNAPSAPLWPGAQDRLSVLIQLGAMIAADPARYVEDTRITVQTASTREADAWVFSVLEKQTLRLPGGELATLRLERSPRRDFDIKLEVWYALAMDFVPVRVRLTQANGDFVDQQWVATQRW